MARRYPGAPLDDDMDALHEPLAGHPLPGQVHRRAPDARRAGGRRAPFRGAGDRLVIRRRRLTVTTNRGTYRAEKLVIAAGAWLPKLAPELNLPSDGRTQRAVLVRARPLAGAFRARPTARLDPGDRRRARLLRLPDRCPARAPKLRVITAAGRWIPTRLTAAASDADEQPVRDFMAHYMPLANGRRLDSRVCMYTNTPDFNFILDFHPDDERVVIASPCSGHGFKFSNVIGSIVADLALTGRTSFEIEFLSLDRLLGARATAG